MPDVHPVNLGQTRFGGKWPLVPQHALACIGSFEIRAEVMHRYAAAGPDPEQILP